MRDDLTNLKDDMTAFIEGHGLRRFRGYVNDEVRSVMWDPGDNPDGWKDFVELAKTSGATFLTMNDVTLEKEELDFLIERLRNANYPNEEDLDDARWLKSFVGRVGFLQLGFPHQGTMFLYEVSTQWYDRYQRLVDVMEEVGGIVIDETDQDDER